MFNICKHNTGKYIFTNRSCGFSQKVAEYLINNFRYLDANIGNIKKVWYSIHLMYYFKYLNIHAKKLTIIITEDSEFNVYVLLSIPLQQ